MRLPFLAVLLCLGCGSNSNPTDGGPDDGGGGGGDGNMTGDTGGVTDSGLPPTKFTGIVLVSSTNTATSMRYDIFGDFEQTPMGTSSMSCTTTMDGPCTFYDCVNLDAGAPQDGGAPVYLKAGALEIDVGANMIMVPQMANNEYRAQGGMPIYSGGESVHAKATGDPMGAPAFDLSVTAPSRITVTQPAYPPMGGLVISRAQAFDVKWTGGATGRVYVSLATYPTGGYKAAACQVDASQGGVTISAASMAKLTAGGGYLAISCLSQATNIQGDWGFILEAYNTAVETGGRAVSLFNATVQ